MLKEEKAKGKGKPKRKNDSLDRWTMATLFIVATITLILFVVLLSMFFAMQGEPVVLMGGLS